VLDHSLGLHHVAIHVPTRADLAQMVVRALQRRVRISPTDHLVSEAVYLRDADNNGIEITFETPWRGRIGEADEGFYVPLKHGSPQSDREPINLDDLLVELCPTPTLQASLPARMLQASMPAGAHIGHIRLDVHDLDWAMAFYRNRIGLGGLFIMRRFGRGDLGLYYTSQGLAFNVWDGINTGQRPARQAGQRPARQAGLRRFGIGIVLPNAAALEAMKDRLRSFGATFIETNIGLDVRDPVGNLALETVG